MRKIIVLCASAFALLLASCGGKNGEAKQPAEQQDSISKVIISEEIVPQLDSLFDIVSGLADADDFEDIIEHGSINLTAQQKMVKPDYLLTQDDIKDLITLQDKYVAEAFLAVDKTVAGLYDMDEEDDYYKNTMQRLASETETANKAKAEEARDADISIDNVRGFYMEMKQRNRLDKFYIAQAAYLVEGLYIISKNTGLFMPAVDDKHAASISKHLNAVISGVDVLAKNNPDIQSVADALAPLKEVNAANAGELKGQINKLRPQLEAARKNLLGK